MSTPRRLEDLERGLLDSSDQAVLERVNALHTTLDPVPDGLVDRIAFGITLDALHGEIAELQRSSELAGVRSDSVEARTVTFTSTSLTTMITVTPTSADRARIDGWIAPGGPLHVEVRTPDGTLSTQADDDGRFVLESVPRGLVQIVVRGEAGSAQPPVIAPSIEI